MDFAKVILKQGKEKSILRKHPWVFSGAVYGVSDELEDGQMVDVTNYDGNHLATGFYSNKGSIVVRILTFNNEVFNEDFWGNRLKAAWNLRLKLFNIEETNAFRLIHGEGDEIPGLIIDYYNKNFVIQAHSTGIYLSMKKISEAIQKCFPDYCETIYCKSANTLPNTGTDFHLFGKATETVAKENNIQFHVNWVEGQKTGFFLDQRPNRFWVQQNAKGKKVLDVFSYVGGFGIHALKGNAKSLTSIDISQHAMEVASENIELNKLDASKWTPLAMDAFIALENLIQENKQFDIVIIDPPSFAKQASEVSNALKQYERLARLGRELVAKNGTLILGSCSSRITLADFQEAHQNANITTSYGWMHLHTTLHDDDHPITFPESNYLKTIFYRRN